MRRGAPLAAAGAAAAAAGAAAAAAAFAALSACPAAAVAAKSFSAALSRLCVFSANAAAGPGSRLTVDPSVLFNKLDVNSDGKINAAEITQGSVNLEQ